MRLTRRMRHRAFVAIPIASVTIPSALRASCDALWAVNACDTAGGPCVDFDLFHPTVFATRASRPEATGAVFFTPSERAAFSGSELRFHPTGRR